MHDVPFILGYALVMLGGIVLMWAFGLTGMVSRYAQFAGGTAALPPSISVSRAASWPYSWYCSWWRRSRVSFK